MKRFTTFFAALTLAVFALTGSAGDEKSIIDGDYEIVSVEVDGKKLDVGKDTRATIAKGKFTVKRGDEVVSAGTFKLDATKKPMALDTTYTEGAAKGKSFKGIAKLEDSVFTFCRPGSPDADRPTEFKSAEGSGAFLASYKKVK